LDLLVRPHQIFGALVDALLQPRIEQFYLLPGRRERAHMLGDDGDGTAHDGENGDTATDHEPL